WEAKLLALLGPSEGKGCAIPQGLRDTGQRISGDASWYGGSFAGGPTASGATFDPSLFTAAHRTLPLGVFLRVHYNGNCAIVLVNDRGPYGNYQRIIDLAHPPAPDLGIGVAPLPATALGITNQRETTVLWDRETLAPAHPAIVWQDRRTAPLCEELRAEGLEQHVREHTGLVIDPYFSGTKLAWLLDNVDGLRAGAEA